MKKHLKKIVFGALAVTVVASTVAIGSNVTNVSKKTEPVQNVEMATTETGITMHFKWEGATPHLYYYNVDGNGKKEMSYPGVPMNNDGNNWYSYTIADAKTATMMISSSVEGYQTGEFEKAGGEYWYDINRGWFAENPDQEKETGVVQVAGKDTTPVKQEVVDVDAQQVAADTGITIHYPASWENCNIYYWNALPNDMETKWPGNPVTKDEDGYFTYTFADVSKINFLFTNGSEQSADFSVKAGEWWYKNGKWTNKKPSVGPNSTPIPYESSGDFRDETIYFLMTTRFYDGDSSNNRYCWDDEALIKSETNNDPGWRGDFKGLIEKLDYIKALGFSAIWITPVVENASGLDYHGYHAYDFSKVDPRYESSDCTYQDLINACHEKGIKVVQDIVLNHTGNWGERNLFHMFDKDEDDGSSTKSAFMSVAKDGNKASELQAGVKMYGQGASDYDDIEVNANIPDYKKPGAQFDSRLAAMKEDSIDLDRIYHHEKTIQWEGYTVQTGQMAGDCVDINTENPVVAKYLRDCYVNYINMGVDGFRVDTVKHISRLTFNMEFIPYFKEAGGDNFFIFGEACVRRHETFNAGIAPISVCFYTWKEPKGSSYVSGWKTTGSVDDVKANEAAVAAHYTEYMSEARTSNNAFLNGNEYHEPDTSEASGFDQIDFRMHWAFKDANSAYSAALDEDKHFNDSTYNVVYVDSHDYAPDTAPESQRFAGSQDTWAENLNLMFTFRGIPCIYYGSEIEFQKGMPIDPMVNNAKKPYKESGRAYFGDEIEGSVTATDYGVYSNASGKMAETLSHPLAKHIQRLNRIRRAVPALCKGQYKSEGNGLSYRRRYTANGEDSYVLVNLSGSCTFNDVLNGEYVELVTGKTVTVSNGTLTTESVGKGNMRVYVLQNDTAEKYGATGKIGEDGTYLK